MNTCQIEICSPDIKAFYFNGLDYLPRVGDEVWLEGDENCIVTKVVHMPSLDKIFIETRFKTPEEKAEDE